MNKIKFLILILPIFLLTGCWNYNELNNLALITGISIDKEDNEFVMNYMISNAKKSDSSSNSNEASTVLYEGKGDTIAKAAENINQKLPKIPYLSHAEVIIISEDIAKENMLKVMDFLLRNPESRKEIYVLISKGSKASDSLSILTPLDNFPSENIKSNITSSPSKSATTYTIKYSEFLAKLITEGIEPTIGVIEIEGDIEKGQDVKSNDKSKQEAVIKLTSTAIFKQDKLVYITDTDESIAINLFNNRLSNTYIETDCQNDKIVTFLTDISIKKKIKLEDNKPKVKIEFEGNGALLEVNCKINLEDSEVIKDIRNQVEERIKQLLESGINVSKKYKTDILGFGNILYKYHPKYWNKIKNNWSDEYLEDLDVEIKTNINLSSKGSLEQTIKEEIK